MENAESLDLLLYKDMASYDFTKIINVSVTIEETYRDHVVDPIESVAKEEKWFSIPKKNQIDIQNNHIIENNRMKCVDGCMITSKLFDPNSVQNLLQTNYATTSRTTVNGLSSRNSTGITHCATDIDDTIRSLHIVAKYLIRTLQTYSYYLGIINNSRANYVQTNHAKMKYLETKHYYFGLSRDIAIRELFPQRHNSKFVKAFLDRTRYMAIHEENFHCLEKEVQSIFNELMMWIEQDKRSDNFSHTQSLNNKNNTQLPPNKQNNCNYNINDIVSQRDKIGDQGINQTDPKTCVFTYGSPGQEVTLNVSTQILNDISQQTEVNNLQINDTRNVKDVNTKSNHIHRSTSHQIQRNRVCSTSRNSGIMSLYNDDMIDLCDEDQTTNTLLSSSSPSLVPTVLGSCRICGAEARLTCTACDDYYYCGPACQALDWSKHRLICRIKYD